LISKHSPNAACNITGLQMRKHERTQNQNDDLSIDPANTCSDE